jgi:hypothetical protein
MMIGTAEREAVLARQHQVEQDEIDPAVGQDFAHGAAVRRRAHPEALLGQCARDEIADLAMIVDDEDVGRALHERSIDPCGGSGRLIVCQSVASVGPDKLCHTNPSLGKTWVTSWVSNTQEATNISVAEAWREP